MSPSTHMVTEPTGHSLQRLAQAAAERTGDGTLLIFDEQRWTGSRLAARARRLSAGLRAAGLDPGERAVVCMSNRPEVNVAYQAIWRCGGIVTPALFLLSAEELRHVLADSEAVAVITTPEFQPLVASAAQGLKSLRTIVVAGLEPGRPGPVAGLEPGRSVLSFAALEAGPEGELVDVDPASPAALMYTGGTTGRAKGVLLSHDALSSSAWVAADAQFDDEDADLDAQRLPTLLLPLPLAHAYGLMVTIAGLHAPYPRTSVLMRWFDPVGWLDLAERHRVGTATVVPSMLQLLLQQPLEERDLSALTRVTCGGAPLPQEVAEEFGRRLPGVEIGEGYGCTETAAIISTTPKGQARPGSVGLPAPGVSIRVERPDGSEAAPGEAGEICVRGPGMMTGYWRSESETAHALRGGWFHTGDVGRQDADGYLFVVDRIKDLIIRGGFNVYPRDVEEVMLAHPDVIGAAVIGRPHSTYGEEVVAFVRLRPGATAGPSDLVAHAREQLSATTYPREVRIVDEVPLTSVGKIDRKRLRQDYRPSGPDPGAPRRPVP
jgi:long-chain acyl-CoA synthetase